VSLWPGYLVAPPTLERLTIPPLVMAVASVPTVVEPMAVAPGIDPAAVERFVTGHAYISRGIGMTDTVLFGDRQITVRGSLDGVRQR
jgi:hypothetical protein